VTSDPSGLKSVGMIARIVRQSQSLYMLAPPLIPLEGRIVRTSCSPEYGLRLGEMRVTSVDGSIVRVDDLDRIATLCESDWLYVVESSCMRDPRSGTFRVHFNRHGAAPLVWCVATDEWELAIASIAIAGVDVRTVYRPKATPDDEDGKPSAWLEVTGVLAVVGGEARITRGA
jgi:hypothetical protein